MPFDSSLKKHSPIVAICRKCNFAIKKMGKKGVIQYLEAKSKRMKKNLLLVQ